MTDQVQPALEGGFRTNEERLVGARLRDAFERSPESFEDKLNNFSKFTRRQAFTKLLAQYEIYKRILPVKGSVVECGVLRGGSLFNWFHLSSVLEPLNFTRRIYGFDTFEGFASVADQDRAALSQHVRMGDLRGSTLEELAELVKIHDSNRVLNHIDKVKLVKGDGTRTIPEFVAQSPHLVVSLLYLDFDLYEPTCVALETLLPRMPRGAVIAFDELDNPLWPGETRAALDKIGLSRLRLERVEFDPYIGFAVLD